MPSTGAGRKIFICHAAADKEVAGCLKTFLEDSDKPVDVFVASHPEDLPGGVEWWKEIRYKLSDAGVMLTLFSPRSPERPWIYFESGGAYFKGIHVIPLAVPPESRDLPPPLGVLQARHLGALEDVRALVGQLGHVLGVRFSASPEKLARELSAIFERLEGTDETAQVWK